MSLPLSFITESGIMAGIEVTVLGCHDPSLWNNRGHCLPSAFNVRGCINHHSVSYLLPPIALRLHARRHASIGNERRSGGTCGTTYWITPVRHEAADAESAPMPLTMPCLVPRHGGGSIVRHEHWANGRLSNSSELPYLTTTTRTKGRVPPSPLALAIIGHLHLLAPLPHQALHKLSNCYGPLIHLFLGSVPCVVVSSPEMAKEFLKTHETSFANRPQTAAVDYLTYGSADFSFAPYGPYWKFMKKLCTSKLLDEAIDVGEGLMRVTNNIISRMTMSQRCSENENEADEVTKLVKATAELTGKFNLSDYIWFCKHLDMQGFGKRLKDVRDRFDSMMEKIIKEHEEARKEEENMDGGHAVKDLLHILLDISEDKSSEMRLTRENIKAFVLVNDPFFFIKYCISCSFAIFYFF
ncbi:hypothetical protein CMV_028715 [Castanea mollissima]|uniref:Uncharacterized protein n=1 Tax=Castanea mollissima TaxID=60419 RepID=A0A8J4QFR4_9ROSI|nr:hypothetical protein CMV_028715 [Castanea mollissima]